MMEQKKAKINLHSNQKLKISLVAAFSVTCLLISMLVAIAVNSDCSQLQSLVSSSYEYSVFANKGVGQDEYYKFNAGIGFSTTSNLDAGVIADVVMQVPGAQYTKAVSWNTAMLDKNEIAVSNSIARKCHKTAGDKMYSKHVVSGEIKEYTIATIIPDVVESRTEKNYGKNDGLIILGNDDEYISNLTYGYIVFVNVPVESLTSISPMNILYRSDEIQLLCKRIVPYAILQCILFGIAGVCLTWLLVNDVKNNYKRKIVLGFDKSELESSLFSHINISAVGSTILSLGLSLVMVFILSVSKASLIIVILGSIVEVISILISGHVLNRKMWRQ